MAAENLESSDYDAYADEYARATAWRERPEAHGDPWGILPDLLELLGDVTGRAVLDAGCGDGYLSRALARRGAHVTGIDLSPRLIANARARDPDIDYRVADLSKPQPADAARFDAVGSYLVLNDVRDYQGFIVTLAAVLRPGGRLVLAINNPYGAVIRTHVADYFASGAKSPYRGLWEVGIKSYHYHRTLQDYLDAFLGCGLRLDRLIDVRANPSTHETTTVLPEGGRFPRFMLLGFTKPIPPAGSGTPGKAGREGDG
jgi:2-polyprenyl-3-methyl-5-hydroxy-6-metoxy-1,4-benzoquinol methylase